MAGSGPGRRNQRRFQWEREHRRVLSLPCTRGRVGVGVLILHFGPHPNPPPNTGEGRKSTEASMAQFADREHFIPIRLSDLLDLLCKEPLGDAERGQLRSLSRLLTAIFHFEYHQSLETLKEAYAPFDPDQDIKALAPWSDEERARRLDELFKNFDELMTRANFTRLTREKLEEAFSAVSAWGIPMEVDFNQFERLEVYSRGDTASQRVR